jgi:hypothetical protein
VDDIVIIARSREKIIEIYRAFNLGGNRAGSVEPEQHLSRIAAVTADSRMSH